MKNLMKSIEMENFELMKSIASPILNGDAYYIKYKSKSFMDLHIEAIDSNQFSIAHYFLLNGDMMADPDIVCEIDKITHRIIPITYQLDSLGIYQIAKTDPELQNDLSNFLNEWLKSLKYKGYEINKICTHEVVLKVGENDKELIKFCNQHKLNPKIKVKKREEQKR